MERLAPLLRIDGAGTVQLDIPLSDISYVVTYGVGSVQITQRSGAVHRVAVGARQMMRWRSAIQQAMGTGY